MRAAFISYGLLALAVMRIGAGYEIGDPNREIPMFFLLEQSWVCVDRNPTQINREDCSPRVRASEDRRK